jgi:hypothetical protein
VKQNLTPVETVSFKMRPGGKKKKAARLVWHIGFIKKYARADLLI